MKKKLNSSCSGCAACYNSCPKNCISMQLNDEGFFYPIIDESLCINCGLCEKVCPVSKDYVGHERGKAYACINQDREIRMKSSSGGVFTPLAEHILNMGGVVFGAAYDENFDVHHIAIRSKNELSKLRGSKYLQSRIGDTYKEVKTCLNNGECVVFTGTPCQISGLKAYLDKDYDNLFLLDIICHGVPSHAIWHKYLRFVEIKCGKINKDVMPEFRNKKYGWKRFRFTIFGESGKIDQRYMKNPYMLSFVKDLCLRSSCYECHSKSLNRQSDITLADFWRIGKLLPEFDDNKGTSLVLINSKKGQLLFDSIRNKLKYKEVDLTKAVEGNVAAYKSAVRTSKRDAFINEMKETTDSDFEKVVKKYTKTSLMRKIMWQIKNR